MGEPTATCTIPRCLWNLCPAEAQHWGSTHRGLKYELHQPPGDKPSVKRCLMSEVSVKTHTSAVAVILVTGLVIITEISPTQQLQPRHAHHVQAFGAHVL